MENLKILTQEDLLNHSIENHSIFGDYKQNENRVTCALLHVLNYGGSDMIDAFIEAFGGEVINSAPLIATQIKLTDGKNTIKYDEGQDCCADGLIVSDYRYKIYIESKIDCNAIRKGQLDAYKRNVNPGMGEYLLYITPDIQMPSILDDWVYWMNWNDVLSFLYEYLATKAADALLEYLIDNFKKLIDKFIIHKKQNKAKAKKENQCLQDIARKKLVTKQAISSDDNQELVLIVGGRWGEKIALLFDFYACQPDRFFLPTKYMAFYYNHRIEYLFKIVHCASSIELTDQSLDINEKYFKDYDPAYKGSTDKAREVFKLELVRIFPNGGIINASKDKNGKPCAFVQRQRYTTIEKILTAKDTSEL